MSNYIEYQDRVAFHPGYYIKEIVEETGVTQEDFAKRLGTTPKNLSILINGEQSLSIDLASRLSRMLGTSIAYWLNLQQKYDEMRAEFLSTEELKKEREIFKLIDYSYFRDHLGFPALTRKIDEQIQCLRRFLKIGSLTVLKKENLATSFRQYTSQLSTSNIVNANVMVQIAVNATLKTQAPKYDKKKFLRAVEFALTQTENHENFLSVVQAAFLESGVVLVVLPNLKNSGINGATKKVDGKIMLMVNDRRHYADTFWFTMFHEIGHIMCGEFGITFQTNQSDSEHVADTYAQEKLIPQQAYDEFLRTTDLFNEENIKEFAKKIQRDPGIVFGRLQNDGKISWQETELGRKLRHRYTVVLK